MKGRSRKRILSREELELWARVTRHDEPLARPSVLAAGSDDIPLMGSSPDTGVAPAPIPPPVKAVAKPVMPAARTQPSSPPLPAPFDQRLSRRIARGRREIDARLDLHGLRQQDAYVALRRFLAKCQAEGHRHVLIITGKGGNGDDSERDYLEMNQRGVLRRLVPQWLSEPSLRIHVISFTESALRHGGSGALYVTVRKHTSSR